MAVPQVHDKVDHTGAWQDRMNVGSFPDASFPVHIGDMADSDRTYPGVICLRRQNSLY